MGATSSWPRRHLPTPAWGPGLFRSLDPIVVVAVGSMTALLTLYAASLGPRSGFGARSTASSIVGPGTDYSIIIWGPIRGLLSGFNVYDPSATEYLARFDILRPATVHSPSLLLMFGWTGLLPERIGFTIFTGISALALGTAVAAATHPWVAARPGGKWMTAGLVVLMVGSTGPVRLGFYLGQVTTLVALGVVLAFTGRNAKTVATGVALMAISPQTAITMTLLLLAARGRRQGLLLGWMVTFAASMPALVLASANAGGVSELVSSAFRGSSELVGTNRIDIPHLFIGSNAVDLAIGVLALVAVGLFLHRYRIHLAERREDLAPLLGFVMVSTTVLAVYHQPYDLILVLLAAAVLAVAATLDMTRAPTTILATALLLSLGALSALAEISAISGHPTWLSGFADPLAVPKMMVAVTLTLALLCCMVISRSRIERDRYAGSAPTQ